MTDDDPFDTPEKKYIRDHWYEFAEKRKRTNQIGFIRYCTFPGKNCHDVNKLKPLLKTTDIGFTKDLTFFEKDPEAIADIWGNLPGAQPYQGYFEDFVSAAWENRNVQPDPSSGEINPFSLFPYDVFNLDYTGPAFKHQGKKTSSEMSAISKLFEIQSFKHKSFTLFITFPAVMSWDNDQGIQEVNRCIKQCVDDPNCTQFQNAFIEKFGRISYPYAQKGTRCPLKYKDFLLIGIPIILLNFGFRNRFDIICRKRYSYIGSGNDTVMVSFIFDCEFLDSERYTGDINTEMNRRRLIRLGEIFSHYEDINQLFNDNEDLKTRYIS